MPINQRKAVRLAEAAFDVADDVEGEKQLRLISGHLQKGNGCARCAMGHVLSRVLPKKGRVRLSSDDSADTLALGYLGVEERADSTEEARAMVGTVCEAIDDVVTTNDSLVYDDGSWDDEGAVGPRASAQARASIALALRSFGNEVLAVAFGGAR